MKISPKDLPAHIAEALKPRTFAQERPEDGQEIEIQWCSEGYDRVTYNAATFIAQDGLVAFADGTSVDIGEEYESMLWRPILELEDEAPEPERALPDTDSYFIVNNGLAYMDNEGDWMYACNPDGLALSPIHHHANDLPDTWAPLSDLIAKAARCDDVEKELLQEQYARRHWEESSDANFARVGELEADVMRHADMVIDSAARYEAEIRELQAKIKQQDALLDLADNFVFRNAHGRICTDDTNVVELLDGLEARRKAREASE